MKKKLITAIVSTLTVIIFIFTILIIILGIKANSDNSRLKIFGYSYSVIASDSMETTIKVGDIIISKDLPYEDIVVGDIIVFFSEDLDKYICHRVIEINSDRSLVTKGDNPRATVDSKAVTIENYEAKVVKHSKIIGLGTLVLQYKNLAFAFIFLIFVLIILNEVFSIIKIAREEKEKQIKEEIKKTYQEERAKMKEEILKELEDNNK